MGTGEGEEIKLAEVGGAGKAERLDRVEDFPTDAVVVSPKGLAGGVRAKGDRCSRREVDEIEGIDVRLGETGFVGDPALEGSLNRGIVDQGSRLRAKSLGADQLAVTDHLVGNIVLGE